MKQVAPLILLFIVAMSCKEPENSEKHNNCHTTLMDSSLNYPKLIHSIDPDFLKQTTELPDNNGALSRNKDGYFSVRFQIKMTNLIDIAITEQRNDALNEYLKALSYAFSFQNSDGSFQLTVPVEFDNNATHGDSISAMAFFGYALGKSLNAITNSLWLNTNNNNLKFKNHIDSFIPKIEKMLSYLLDNQEILKQTDKNAPNRLLFDAIAFYVLGEHTTNTKSKEIGIEFLEMAIRLTDEKEGYFIEGGGWDTSYNGVAIMLGLELYSMLPKNHPSKHKLGRQLACATEWQKSMILNNGEISTEGNTRVYPGGESFLGNKKKVDVEKTVRAFYYFSEISDNIEYKELAKKIFKHYQP